MKANVSVSVLEKAYHKPVTAKLLADCLKKNIGFRFGEIVYGHEIISDNLLVTHVHHGADVHNTKNNTITSFKAQNPAVYSQVMVARIEADRFAASVFAEQEKALAASMSTDTSAVTASI